VGREVVDADDTIERVEHDDVAIGDPPRAPDVGRGRVRC
jgi:hypothetical protein